MKENLNNKLLHQDFNSDDNRDIEPYLKTAAVYAATENAIAVFSDLKMNRSHIFYGGFGEYLGMAEKGTYRCIDTIWEDEIFSWIMPEDIQTKQLDEIQFFDYVRHSGKAGDHFMTDQITMLDKKGSHVRVTHRIFYFSDGNAIRFALCLYTPSNGEISSSITDSVTGNSILLQHIDTGRMLSVREKEVLKLIDEGMSSKEIASHLNISIYTVSRHRQNILEKLRAKNSSHACRTAKSLKLI